MNSMTGYSESSFLLLGVRFTYRLKSLNSKYLEINFSFPHELKWLEIKLEKYIRDKIIRGKIDVFLEADTSLPKQPIINQDVLKEYQSLFNTFYEKKKVTIPIEVLASLPGCLDLKIKRFDEYQSKFEYHFAKTLLKLDASRKREGKKMLSFIVRRFKFLRRLNYKISLLHSSHLQKQEIIVRSNISKIFLEEANQVGLHIKQQDKYFSKFWLESKEEVLKLISADITEEIDRLKAHFIEIEQFIAKEENIGRKIEFYLQELSREINTITSKTHSLEIKQLTIQMKIDIEKIKEQVRNIE